MIEHVERNFRNFSSKPSQYFKLQYGYDTTWQYAKNLINKMLGRI